MRWQCSDNLNCTRPEAFYQFFRNQTQTVFQEEIILQEVLRLRGITSQLGTRKLLHKMKDFFERHGFSVGRDEFFDLLRDQQLLELLCFDFEVFV